MKRYTKIFVVLPILSSIVTFSGVVSAKPVPGWGDAFAEWFRNLTDSDGSYCNTPECATLQGWNVSAGK